MQQMCVFEASCAVWVACVQLLPMAPMIFLRNASSSIPAVHLTGRLLPPVAVATNTVLLVTVYVTSFTVMD